MQEQSARLSEVVGVFKLHQLAAVAPARVAARMAAPVAAAQAPRQLSARASAQPAPAARKPVAALAGAKEEWEAF
jgi:methyl-accepting chemotaxis protein